MLCPLFVVSVIHNAARNSRGVPASGVCVGRVEGYRKTEDGERKMKSKAKSESSNKRSVVEDEVENSEQ